MTKKGYSYPDYNREYKLRMKYGITVEQYEELLAAQEGVCAICGGPPNGKGRLHVDHCHDRGIVRGLLCLTCNAGLGILENTEFVEMAESYLMLGASQPITEDKGKGGDGGSASPGDGIGGSSQASVRGGPAPGPHTLEAWRVRAEVAEEKVRNMEIREERRYLETPFLSPQEEIERLRDELFWTRNRAEQAEQDAARWLERLCDLEDQIEWQRYGPKKVRYDREEEVL